MAISFRDCDHDDTDGSSRHRHGDLLQRVLMLEYLVGRANRMYDTIAYPVVPSVPLGQMWFPVASTGLFSRASVAPFCGGNFTNFSPADGTRYLRFSFIHPVLVQSSILPGGSSSNQFPSRTQNFTDIRAGGVDTRRHCLITRVARIAQVSALPVPLL